jgi:hypothetical protein
VKGVIKELSKEIVLAKNERQQHGGASGWRLALTYAPADAFRVA